MPTSEGRQAFSTTHMEEIGLGKVHGPGARGQYGGKSRQNGTGDLSSLGRRANWTRPSARKGKKQGNMGLPFGRICEILNACDSRKEGPHKAEGGGNPDLKDPKNRTAECRKTLTESEGSSYCQRSFGYWGVKVGK